MYPFVIIIGGILVLYIYITRPASKEIFSPSNKIDPEVGRAKDLSALLYEEVSLSGRYKQVARSTRKTSGSYFFI
jgi:hypothetical protein